MKFKILMTHNRYLKQGGEDSVVKDEIALLRKHGHEVLFYERNNSEISTKNTLSVARDTIWSPSTISDVNEYIRAFKPDIIHAHNTFPLISPSLYWVASSHSIPVIQTLHNFRLLCPQAMLLRNGHICTDCIGKSPWRGVIRKCYRHSAAQSLVLATSLITHRLIGTFENKVTRYIALNDFCRKVFIRAGLPEHRISVKPNFVDIDHSDSEHTGSPLFVGRLSYEKGIDVLVKATNYMQNTMINVVGDGPLAHLVADNKSINFRGWIESNELYRMMRSSSFLILPSIWYENFPRTIVEAFACGLPVIASRLGALEEIIDDGFTGLLFTPGSETDLAEKIMWAKNNPDDIVRMGHNARHIYEEKYTPDVNYKQLTHIYKQAIYTKS